jgi:putative transposase
MGARYSTKGRSILFKGAKVKYRFINEHRYEYRVATMFWVLKVARAGFYAWLHQPNSNRAIQDDRLLGLICDPYVATGGVYGSPRVFADLRGAGESCGKHRIERIMRNHKIKAIRGYKSPKAVTGRPSILAPNGVNREFTVDAPDLVWVTDITYNRAWQGWPYLAVVLDLHSRAVVSWSMKTTIAKEVVLDALMMAVCQRKPTQEVIVHSDQGSQYGSDDWKRFCDANKLLPSMSRRGNC